MDPIVAQQGLYARVLDRIPTVQAAYGRANAQQLSAVQKEHPDLEVFTVPEWESSNDAMVLKYVVPFIDQAIRDNARVGWVTEGMHRTNEKKSGEWILAHAARRLLTPAQREALVVLDVESQLLEPTIEWAAQGSSLRIVIVNDGSFSGGQQSKELVALKAHADAVGVTPDVMVIVPFATDVALHKLRTAIPNVHVPDPVRKMRGREDLGLSSFAMFEHKSMPVWPACRPEFKHEVDRRLHPAYDPDQPLDQQPEYLPVYKAETAAWQALVAEVAALAKLRVK